MATKKNIAGAEHLNLYIPPRLVKTKQGWYVVYYHEVAGQWVRERKTFNLNRVKDKRRRMEMAQEIIEALQDNLTGRREGVEQGPESVLFSTPVIEAVDFAAKLKMQSPKKDSRKVFKSVRDMLARFIEKKKWTKMAVAEFRVRHAQAFLDDCLIRGISNTTFNNYRNFCVTLFNILIKREYLKDNPFSKIEIREEEEKGRRPFTKEERAVVLAEIYRIDYWLFILVMLTYLELLRRTECYRLRFSNFNLQEGYIHLPATATKNGQKAIITIPDALRTYLLDDRFIRQPTNYLLFGKGCRPHPSVSAGEQSFKAKHRRVLRGLQSRGKLGDITGLSLYSWKDTGMTEMSNILDPIRLRDHARHKSIDQSLEYYHAKRIIKKVKRKVKVPEFALPAVENQET